MCFEETIGHVIHIFVLKLCKSLTMQDNNEDFFLEILYFRILIKTCIFHNRQEPLMKKKNFQMNCRAEKG